MSKYLEGFSAHITGITRHGKSYWTKKVFIPLLVKFKPIMVFDYKGEYAGPRAKDSDTSWRSYPDLVSFFLSIQKAGMLSREVHIIRAAENSIYNKGLSFVSDLKLQVCVILDEAQFIFLDSKLRSAEENLIKLVRAGAGEGTDVIMISQRVMDMPPHIRSQINRRVTFRQEHSSDIDVMYKDNGFMDAEKARDLGKKEYIIFGDFPDYLQMDKLKLAQDEKKTGKL